MQSPGIVAEDTLVKQFAIKLVIERLTVKGKVLRKAVVSILCTFTSLTTQRNSTIPGSRHSSTIAVLVRVAGLTSAAAYPLPSFVNISVHSWSSLSF